MARADNIQSGARDAEVPRNLLTNDSFEAIITRNFSQEFYREARA